MADYKNPYAYDLPTSFSNSGRNHLGSQVAGNQSNWLNDNVFGGAGSGPTYNYDTAGADVTDRDVRGAQAAWNQMTHGDAGTSNAEQTALYNQYLDRIKLKNQMGQNINTLSSGIMGQEDNLRRSAASALGQGVDAARNNFNRRGLLYSGARQGAEQSVRSNVAGALSSSLSGTEREATNAIQSSKEAYAAVGAQNEAERVQLAKEAFITASANSIARAQAMQQLGSGLGSAFGTTAGSQKQEQERIYVGSPERLEGDYSNPMPQMGSQYSYNPYDARRYQGLLSGGRSF